MPYRARLPRPRRRVVQGLSHAFARRGDELHPRALRPRAGPQRRGRGTRRRRDGAGDRRARDVQPLRRHVGRRWAGCYADTGAPLRSAPDVVARRRSGQRLPPGRLLRPYGEVEPTGAGELDGLERARRQVAATPSMATVCTAAKPTSTGCGPNFASTGPAITSPSGVPRPQIVVAADIAFARIATG